MKPSLLAILLLMCVALTCCADDSGSSSGSGTSGGATSLIITVTNLPSGDAYRGYSEVVSASGGSGTGYTWSIVNGSLPPGMAINASGTPSTSIYGIPTATGSYSFTVQVQDSAANTATQAYTIQLVQPTPSAEFWTVPATGRLLFVVEASGPMAGAGIATLRAELTNTVSELLPTDAFDIVVFSDWRSGYFESLWGTPQAATTANISTAVSWINGPALNPGGMSDSATYAALEESFVTYTNIDRAFLAAYSTPTNAAQILNDYPAWLATDPTRTQVVVSMHSASATWGQQLAALAGGIYVP